MGSERGFIFKLDKVCILRLEKQSRPILISGIAFTGKGQHSKIYFSVPSVLNFPHWIKDKNK